jgi:hypothetical protein
MNRFAFPSEWTAKNWPQKAASDTAVFPAPENASTLAQLALPATQQDAIIEVRVAGAVVQVSLAPRLRSGA